MGLFGPSLPIDREELDWLLACFAWLHRKLGEAAYQGPLGHFLVTPETQEIQSAQSARELFDAVKSLAGLGEWHCVLRQGQPRRETAEAGHIGQYSESYALGTFAVVDNSPVIHYDPALLRTPDALVATFAHELAHLLIYSLGDPPGGDDLHEHATDCAAVYLGFGIFLANTARQFSQFQDGLIGGWSSSVSGYLSERSLVVATAVFVRLSEADPDLAAPHLKPYLRKDYRNALKYIDRHYSNMPDLLEQFDLSAWFPES